MLLLVFFLISAVPLIQHYEIQVSQFVLSVEPTLSWLASSR